MVDRKGFEVVRQARAVIAEAGTGRVSGQTRAEYIAEVRRLISRCQENDLDGLLRTAAETRSKLTYRRRLAAIRFLLMHRINAELQNQDRLQRAKDWDNWECSIRKLQVALANYTRFKEERATHQVASPRPRKSKRASLHGLPAEWRERLWSAMPEKYSTPYLVAALSGCRPAELALGVDVEAKNDKLVIRIAGVKVKQNQGQPWREIAYPLDEPAIRMVRALHERVVAAGCIARISTATTAFTSALRRAGRRLWPERASDITPYSLRHAAASDFKRFLDSEDVSAALGHAVSKTASRYGQWQIGRLGGLRPTSINAPRPIRETISMHSMSAKRSGPW